MKGWSHHTRSFSVNAGYFELPQFAANLLDSLNIENSTDRSGYQFFC